MIYIKFRYVNGVVGEQEGVLSYSLLYSLVSFLLFSFFVSSKGIGFNIYTSPVVVGHNETPFLSQEVGKPLRHLTVKWKAFLSCPAAARL